MAPLLTTQAQQLRRQAFTLLVDEDAAELELSAPDPLAPVAWAGGLPIWPADSGYLLLAEGGVE